MEQKLKDQFKSGFGLILEPPKVNQDAFYGVVFGGVEEPKDWRPYLPTFEERQYNSNFCTNFSYTNCLETIARYEGVKDKDYELNFSDRWSAVKSGTSKTGNYCQKVWEAGRKQGNVRENECPWGEGWLLNPTWYWNEIQDVSKTAYEKLFYGPNYSFVNASTLQMKSALAHSPVNIGVPVGETWSNEVVTAPKTVYGYHAVELAFIDNQYMYIFDSYPPFLKKFVLSYPVSVAGSFRDLPDDWKDVRDQYIQSIQLVFGPAWKPAPIFYSRHLIEKGIYGAVRVAGTNWVWLLGPGGRQIRDEKDFVSVFGTKYQNGIVGIISPAQADKLGIKLPGVGSKEEKFEVNLNKCFLIDWINKFKK